MQKENMTKSQQDLRYKLYVTIFLAILILMVATPFGFIHLGVIKLTLVHIPVILASIIFGPRVGLLMGAAFAASSVIVNTLTPSVLSFAFSPFVPVYGSDKGSIFALVVCFVPRLLVGFVPGFLAQKYEAKISRKHLLSGCLGVFGSSINTVFTLLLLGMCFAAPFAALKGMDVAQAWLLIGSLCVTNGIPEAVAAGFVCSFVVPILRKRVHY